MPNHVTNILTVEGDPERISELKKNIFSEEFGLGTIDFDKIISMPKSEEKHWYDWRIAHWNTKWNAYGYTQGVDYAECSEFNFLTAWSPPHPVIEKLAKMYPDLTFDHKWADEDIGYNCGENKYENGECIDQYYPINRKEAVEYAASVMYAEPEDWGLKLNADGTDYIYDEED